MAELRIPPLPFDTARAQRTFDALMEGGFRPPGAAARTLLEGAFGNSPYLSRLALREQAALAGYFADGPEAALAAAETLALGAENADSEARAMADLRIAKRRAALTIALADISGRYNLAEVTGALTRFADICVGAALRWLLNQAAAREHHAETDGASLERSTGLVVLAMGKYGAFELNYSSDIDLVVFYDADKFPFAKRGDPRGAAVDIVRGLVKLIAEPSRDGYVFRVDLRLRPDAGATQVAISTDAAADYYEAMGQNWERAAMIKARACAGDPAAGAAFLKTMVPFVWRRYLDFAAIEDIHSIKRQIHAHAGHGEIAVAGHNIKLGRGGIREIEFFAQTQQLILGGRHPAVRVSGTLTALDALAAEGRVTAGTAAELKSDYRYLRQLEHRLQMIEDQQTHTVPCAGQELAQVACFMGYDSADAFRDGLTGVLESVQGHYAHLFESEQDLSDARGSLVFTGVEEDPETLETLTAMGYRDSAHVSGAIRGWHHGRIRAMRSERARELLTKLVPSILKALAATADPDAAFAQFDRFLSNLPSGVQLFSLFLAQSRFLELLAKVVGSAPRLATHLARNPSTLDALLDADFLTHLPERATLDAALARQMSGGYEDMLDAARRFAREQIFRVGVQIVEGTVDADAAGPAFAAIAETVIASLLLRVEAELAQGAGKVKGGGLVVVAMGKLGGKEMTASSDLDLVFVYDAPAGTETSDGAKPLPVPLYFARLAQRLIAGLTTPTAAGSLYEVDMRLRPTGNKGPVAVSLESFSRYHAKEAWTWEHMALTRARVVAGPLLLRRQVEAEIERRLLERREAAAIRHDGRQMREKMAASFSDHEMWDLKYTKGGLVDIEFIAQIQQLIHAPARPGVLDPNTIAALGKLAEANCLDAGDAESLIAAARLEHALTQVLRIALDETLKPETATPGLKALLARAGGSPSFPDLEHHLAAVQRQARDIFHRLMDRDRSAPQAT
ncbi:MAG TPA: bifunctional [glutamine synthetase] adenylyltransferase/[glutamine synthetase]-adenylyl-L-tyrosine phosphorylase [Rhizomicrobium sp.]|nr:bifunctional [glutamine synthetase] adenylyltransferase/[glutamine synthetase]-adenylyl-L-tyrosine phosphorylase [Rhizomicrobium sp.]